MPRKTADDDVQELKDLLLKKKKRNTHIPPDEMLDSGCTGLNLACTGLPDFCYVKGGYYMLVGDSTSGKTWLLMQALAEACRNPNFDDYDLIFDDAEGGALMDIRKFFGKKLKRRMKVLRSKTIEDFYFNTDDVIQEGRPFIYCLDSMDALSSAAEEKTFKAAKKSIRAGKGDKGSYGDGKAKKNSSYLRRLAAHIKDTKSILITVSQSRDNIDPFSFETKTRSGGRAMKFYATLEMWTSIAGTLVKEVRKGIKLKQGIKCQIQVKKNRIMGRDRTIQVPIINTFGMDDVGGCVDYLVKVQHWKKAKGKGINAKDLGLTGHRETLIEKIQDGDHEAELREIVGRVWNELEEAAVVKRKRKYT